MQRYRSSTDIIGELQKKLAELKDDLDAYKTRDKSIPDWQTPTLLNNWVAFGAPYATAQYWRDSAGAVHLHGVVKNGNGPPSIIFTLPVGFRPLNDMIYVAFSGGVFGVVVIHANGNVEANSGSVSSFVLDGFVFRAEQ